MPYRIADTRDGTGGVVAAPIGPGGSLSIQVTGRGGVPSSGVAALTLNVTVTNAATSSYLTVYPSGLSRPLASNLNWTRGQTVANLVEVATGQNGMITLYNALGTVDVVVDVAGWTSSASSTGTTDGCFRPVVPARIFDTRDGTGKLGPGQSIDVQVGGVGGVPLAGAEAAVLNITATGATDPSYLSAYPSGSSRPTASNVNFEAGETIANRVMVKLGTAGRVTITNGAGWVDVVIDVGGWYTDATAVSAGGRMNAVAPNRILDTRDGTGAPAQALGQGGTITVQVAGRGGVPSMTSTTPPTAVILNVTATNGKAPSFLSAYPSDASRPGISDLNWMAGQTIPNLVVVKLAPDGTITIYNAMGSVDVVGDVMGWFS